VGNVLAKTARPAHVPPELVFEYDMFNDRRLAVDVHEGMFSLIDEAPDIFWTPLNGGHWMVMRYEHVRSMLMAPHIFGNAQASVRTNKDGFQIKLPPADMDAPDHMKHRLLLLKFLSPPQLRRQEAAILRLMNELIDSLAGKKACEFKAQIAVKLPVVTFLSIMNWDLSLALRFVTWVNDIGSADTEVRGSAHLELLNYIDGMIAERVARPGVDPVSQLLNSEIDGKPISHERVKEMTTLLFTAGLDTVTNAMTFIMRYLAEHPELQDELRANPDKIDKAIEELLRRHSFVNTFRRAKENTVFQGVALEKDDILTLSLCTSSNDECKYPHPREVQIARGDTSHLAFSTGPHNCIGSPLARLELRIFLREWLRRMPNVGISQAWQPRPRGGTVMTLESLDLVW